MIVKCLQLIPSNRTHRGDANWSRFRSAPRWAFFKTSGRDLSGPLTNVPKLHSYPSKGPKDETQRSPIGRRW